MGTNWPKSCCAQRPGQDTQGKTPFTAFLGTLIRSWSSPGGWASGPTSFRADRVPRHRWKPEEPRARFRNQRTEGGNPHLTSLSADTVSNGLTKCVGNADEARGA